MGVLRLKSSVPRDVILVFVERIETKTQELGRCPCMIAIEHFRTGDGALGSLLLTCCVGLVPSGSGHGS